MKKLLLLLTLLSFTISKSQISVSRSHVGGLKNFKEGTLEKFKKTQTIFIFSNLYEKDVYENILKNSWSVTPYKIVSIEDFNLSDYLNDSYSFASIGGHKILYAMKSGGTATYLYTYFDFFLFDVEEKIKELKKLENKSSKKIEKYNLMDKNKIEIARFYLFPKEEFIAKVYSKSNISVTDALLNDEMLYNYKPGFLVNYFQKINQLLLENKTNWMYENKSTSELLNLKKSKLYVSEYIAKNYNPYTLNYKQKSEEEVEDLFKNYKFEFELQSTDQISERILNKEKFYYLRYVRINSERFLQVINSLNGEIIYSDYIAGLGYQLKAKNLKDLNKEIEKAK